LLEGMPIREMALEIFKLKGYDIKLDQSRLDNLAKNSGKKEGNLYADKTSS
jgi:hypothetical protein